MDKFAKAEALQTVAQLPCTRTARMMRREIRQRDTERIDAMERQRQRRTMRARNDDTR